MNTLKKPIFFTLGALCFMVALYPGGKPVLLTNNQAIHKALQTGNVNVLKETIENDPQWIRRRNMYDELPLETAAFAAQPEAVEFLIANGANAQNSTTSYGDPVLCMVYNRIISQRNIDPEKSKKYKQIARTLIKAGATCPDDIADAFLEGISQKEFLAEITEK